MPSKEKRRLDRIQKAVSKDLAEAATAAVTHVQGDGGEGQKSTTELQAKARRAAERKKKRDKGRALEEAASRRGSDITSVVVSNGSRSSSSNNYDSAGTTQKKKKGKRKSLVPPPPPMGLEPEPGVEDVQQLLEKVASGKKGGVKRKTTMSLTAEQKKRGGMKKRST